MIKSIIASILSLIILEIGCRYIFSPLVPLITYYALINILPSDNIKTRKFAAVVIGFLGVITYVIDTVDIVRHFDKWYHIFGILINIITIVGFIGGAILINKTFKE